MITGVIFDLGDTLFRFTGSWPEVFEQGREALVRALDTYGLPVDREEFHKQWQSEMDLAFQVRDEDHVERPTRDILPAVLERFGYTAVEPSIIARVLQEMYAVSEAYWEIDPDAVEVLEEMGRRYRLGVISNAADDSNVQRMVDRAGLRRYFNPLLVSAAEGYRKPDRRLFWKVAEVWQAAPAELVMVGDTLTADILGAQQAGLHQIWISTRADREDNLEAADKIQPEFRVERLAEVPAVVDGLDDRKGKAAASPSEGA